MVGALLGVAILGLIKNGVSLFNVPVEMQYILIGMLLLAIKVQGEGAAPLALTPAERAALARVPHSAATPQRVGGDIVQPGVVHADVSSALSTLPTPLLAMLAFLLAWVLAIAANSIRNRVRSRRAR